VADLGKHKTNEFAIDLSTEIQEWLILPEVVDGGLFQRIHPVAFFDTVLVFDLLLDFKDIIQVHHFQHTDIRGRGNVLPEFAPADFDIMDFSFGTEYLKVFGNRMAGQTEFFSQFFHLKTRWSGFKNFEDLGLEVVIHTLW
jgi:hypothetical protein